MTTIMLKKGNVALVDDDTSDVVGFMTTGQFVNALSKKFYDQLGFIYGAILPTGCKCIFSNKKDSTIYIIQQNPTFVNVKFNSSLRYLLNHTMLKQFTKQYPNVPVKPKRVFKLFMPYSIFMVSIFNRSGIVKLSAFTRPSPITSFQDALHVMPFPNVYSDGMVCMPPLSYNTESHAYICEDAISKFWHSLFNNDITACVGTLNSVSPLSIENYYIWEYLSKTKPEVILSTSFVPYCQQNLNESTIEHVLNLQHILKENEKIDQEKFESTLDETINNISMNVPGDILSLSSTKDFDISKKINNDFIKNGPVSNLAIKVSDITINLSVGHRFQLRGMTFTIMSIRRNSMNEYEIWACDESDRVVKISYDDIIANFSEIYATIFQNAVKEIESVTGKIIKSGEEIYLVMDSQLIKTKFNYLVKDVYGFDILFTDHTKLIGGNVTIYAKDDVKFDTFYIDGQKADEQFYLLSSKHCQSVNRCVNYSFQTEDLCEISSIENVINVMCDRSISKISISFDKINKSADDNTFKIKMWFDKIRSDGRINLTVQKSSLLLLSKTLIDQLPLTWTYVLNSPAYREFNCELRIGHIYQNFNGDSFFIRRRLDDNEPISIENPKDKLVIMAAEKYQRLKVFKIGELCVCPIVCTEVREGKNVEMKPRQPFYCRIHSFEKHDNGSVDVLVEQLDKPEEITKINLIQGDCFKSSAIRHATLSLGGLSVGDVVRKTGSERLKHFNKKQLYKILAIVTDSSPYPIFLFSNGCTLWANYVLNNFQKVENVDDKNIINYFVAHNVRMVGICGKDYNYVMIDDKQSMTTLPQVTLFSTQQFSEVESKFHCVK